MESWFSRGLIKWYNLNKRDLPWRSENDPYLIWLSEVILQQTQVAQGLAYYQRFIQKYPTVTRLARAKEDEVLKLWQGLGYYSRARNLHAAAKFIQTEYRGVFPAAYGQIRALKGVGDYTAAAIASFAYGLPHAVVDGNVYRVLSRLFGIEAAIDLPGSKKIFQQLADELLDKKQPGLYNQAIMEFGSQYCRPVNPDCDNCIFAARCAAYKTNKVALLPQKAKKIKVKTRYFSYLVVVDPRQQVLVNRRGENDIWQGLYEFHLVETQNEIAAGELLARSDVQELIGRSYSLKYSSGLYKHVLTHQHLYARFYVIGAGRAFAPKQKTIALRDLQKLAFSRLTEKFLGHCVLKELF